MGATEQLANALKPAIAGAVTTALSRADGPAIGGSVPAAIIKETTDAAAAIVVNQTNNEPWYQSRVTLGSLLSAIAGILLTFGVVFPSELQGHIINLIIALAPLAGGLFAMYGRWVAKKPLPIGPQA